MSDLPLGWEWTTTRELFTFVTSGSRGWARYYSDKGARFIRVGNLRRGSIDPDLTELQRVSPPAGSEGSRTRVQPNDILISITADLGRIALMPDVKEETYINQHVALARPGKDADARYLAWYLSSDPVQRQWLKLQRGATKLGLGLDDIRSVTVPLAPLDEQHRIVDAIEEQFSRLDAGNSSLRRAQRNLKRARTAILDAAVSGKLIGINNDHWEELALGDLLEDIHAGKSFKCEERPSGLDEWGVVKVSAMTWGRFREGENKTVVDDQRVEPRFEIHPGDLLVSRANTVEYVGAAVLVEKCRSRLLLSDKSLRLVPNARVLPEWLLISLRTSLARRYIESVATGTSDSMRNISQPRLKALRVMAPPINIQWRLVAEVDRMISQIERLDESLNRNLYSAQALRSAILSTAFSGELV